MTHIEKASYEKAPLQVYVYVAALALTQKSSKTAMGVQSWKGEKGKTEYYNKCSAH